MRNAHPGLPELEYVKPGSLEEASKFLVAHTGEARPFLGATDTIVRIRDGAWTPKYLVDVKGLPGTNEIKFDPKEGLTIGAAVSMNKVAAHPDVKKHYPLLVEACNWVASYQLRSRATIVGNVCNASPAGDTIGTSIVLGGVLNVFGPDGIRKEPLSTFFFAPGKTALKPGDIATSISFPISPKDSAGKYLKLGRNRLGDLAIVGVTAFGYPDSSAASGYRFHITLASVGPTPIRAKAAEEILASKPINEETIFEAAVAAMDSCTPIDDTRGTARYRKLMIRNLTKNAVADVAAKIVK
ncbi:MAG: xanthine dehydrogenase family protein subunit M [Anaerolineaceae bacterium]|nr:xanthine dehydrogenase family protein subunit M [Anaerolineaceae bacterium]